MANNIRSGLGRTVLPQLSSPRPNPNARTPQQALQEMTRIMGSANETFMRDKDPALCPGLYNHWDPAAVASGSFFNLGASTGQTALAMMRIKQRHPAGFVPRGIMGLFGTDAIEHRVGLYEISLTRDFFASPRMAYTRLAEGAAKRVNGSLWFLETPSAPELDPQKFYALAWRPEWIGAATPYTGMRAADVAGGSIGLPTLRGAPPGEVLPAYVGAYAVGSSSIEYGVSNALGIPLMQLAGRDSLTTPSTYSSVDLAWMF